MKKTLGCLAVSLFAFALAGCAKGDGTAEKTMPSATAKIATAAEAKGAARPLDVQPEDLVKFGLIPEFTGRLPVITSMGELTEDDLVRVLTEPKNCLVKQYRKLLAIARQVEKDSPELFDDMQTLNPYAPAMRRDFENAWRSVCSGLTEPGDRG